MVSGAFPGSRNHSFFLKVAIGPEPVFRVPTPRPANWNLPCRAEGTALSPRVHLPRLHWCRGRAIDIVRLLDVDRCPVVCRSGTGLTNVAAIGVPRIQNHWNNQQRQRNQRYHICRLHCLQLLSERGAWKTQIHCSTISFKSNLPSRADRRTDRRNSRATWTRSM